jgi:hypothetical protein
MRDSSTTATATATGIAARTHIGIDKECECPCLLGVISGSRDPSLSLLSKVGIVQSWHGYQECCLEGCVRYAQNNGIIVRYGVSLGYQGMLAQSTLSISVS